METPGLYTSLPKGSFRSISTGRVVAEGVVKYVLDILNTRLIQCPRTRGLESLSELIKQTDMEDRSPSEQRAEARALGRS